MNEYILVIFRAVREVVIDGNPSGYQTGEVIELAAGTHTVSLDGLKDFSPTEQDVNPTGTSPLKPRKVHFHKE
jgi:hypothetical protein